MKAVCYKRYRALFVKLKLGTSTNLSVKMICRSDYANVTVKFVCTESHGLVIEDKNKL